MRSLSVYHLYASSVVSVMQSNLQRETVVPGVESAKDSERRSDLVVLKHGDTTHSSGSNHNFVDVTKCSQTSIYCVSLYFITNFRHSAQPCLLYLPPL